MLIVTHVLVWLALADRKLGSKARHRLDAALLKQEEVAVSSISFWEIAMLVENGRLDLDPTAVRVAALQAGIREVSLSGDLAIAAAKLTEFHGDPADRLFVATSLAVQAVLMTADSAILRWRGLATINAAK